MKPKSVAVAASLCLVLVGSASAFQTTTQMNVSLVVEQPQAEVSVTPLVFPSALSGSGNLFASSTITVNATATVLYMINLDRGIGPVGPDALERNMTNSSSQQEHVPYFLYSDSDHSQPWGDNGVTIPAPGVQGVGTGVDQAYDVFGSAQTGVEGGAGAPPGTYTDVVTVTVLF